MAYAIRRMLTYSVSIFDVCWRIQACRVLANMTACSNRTLWEISMRLVFTCVSTHTHTHTPTTHIYSLRLYFFVRTYMHGCKLCVLRVCVCLYLCFCLRDWLFKKIKNIYVRAHAKSTHTKPILTNAPSGYSDWGRICCGKLSTHASFENAYCGTEDTSFCQVTWLLPKLLQKCWLFSDFHRW
jgi:hypothetical protein